MNVASLRKRPSGTTLPRFVRDLLASPPERGSGLNIWLYRVARVLHPFRDANEIIQLLQAATDGELIRAGEIARAVARSKATAWQPGQPSRVVPAPAWPAIDRKARDAIIQSGGGLVDLWEQSPVRIENSKTHTEELIDQLFPGDPLLCCGISKSEFDTRSREEWRGQLSPLAMIVPSPMTARSGLTQEGKESAHALSITGPRRALVIEQDHGAIDEQAAILLHLAECAPLALAVHSGGKSIHGWFVCQNQSEERLRRFMQSAVSLGADHATWCKSQFVRMPDGTRTGGGRQTVFYFDPEVLQ
jgi:hypothetical protein